MSSGRGRSARAGGTKSQRQLRVGELLRHALSEVLERDSVRDPDLAGVSVTVSEVRVSADLRNATAYVMPLGGAADCETVVAALRRAAPFLRHGVAGRISLKYVPTLTFEPDTSFDYAGRIDTLLKSAHPPDDDAPEGADDGT